MPLAPYQQVRHITVPLKIIGVYAGWKVLHHFLSLPGSPLYTGWQHVTAAVGHWYAVAASAVLSAGGLASVAEGININLLASNRQIYVQEHCLAIPAMVLFTGVVFCFAGGLATKLRFIALGLTGIVLINILRLVFVSIAWVYCSERFFEINHSYIYVFVTYSFIFAMLAYYIKKAVKAEVAAG